jgi:hypothetical protein
MISNHHLPSREYRYIDAKVFDIESTPSRNIDAVVSISNHHLAGVSGNGLDIWIEMDSYFMRCHEVKKAEVEKDLDGHVRYVDNAVTRHACFEVYEEHAKYLVQRYPKIFLLEGTTLHN